MKRINLKEELKLNNIPKLINGLDCNYVYIPYTADMLIDSEYVYKNMMLGNTYIPISGLIKGITKIEGKEYLAIENDYKEVEKKAKIKPSKKDLKEYLPEFKKKIDKLYINAIDKDVGCFNKYYLLKEEKKKINKVLETIKSTFNIKDIIIVVNSEEQLEELKNDILGINYELKVVPSYYPIGNIVILREYLFDNKNLEVIDLLTIYNLYYEVIKGSRVIEKYLTIWGNNLEDNYVIKVKINTQVKEYLSKLKLINKDYEIILNNCLCGSKINENYLITEETESIIINKKVKEYQSSCSNCGLCSEVCPVRIDPLKKRDGCIKCGLCNYVCPARIKIVEGDKDEK